MSEDELTEQEQAMLGFEKLRWNYLGAREQAIHDLFGMSATLYHQALNVLLDRPAALVAEPQVVARLRRLRDARRAARSRV